MKKLFTVLFAVLLFTACTDKKQVTTELEEGSFEVEETFEAEETSTKDEFSDSGDADYNASEE